MKGDNERLEFGNPKKQFERYRIESITLAEELCFGCLVGYDWHFARRVRRRSTEARDLGAVIRCQAEGMVRKTKL